MGDLYRMKQISLPPMNKKRAKCGATILPPTIPFHSGQSDIDIEAPPLKTPNIGNLMQLHFKNANAAPAPLPNMANNNENDNKSLPLPPPPIVPRAKEIKYGGMRDENAAKRK